MRGRSGGSLQGDPGLMIDGKIPDGRIHTCVEHSSRHPWTPIQRRAVFL